MDLLSLISQVSPEVQKVQSPTVTESQDSKAKVEPRFVFVTANMLNLNCCSIDIRIDSRGGIVSKHITASNVSIIVGKSMQKCRPPSHQWTSGMVLEIG